MRRRLEAFERRLAALAWVLRGWSRDAEQESQARERHKILPVFLRAGLEHAELYPRESPCLCDLEDPPAWRQPRPFVHPLRRLAERQRPRSLLEALYDMTRRYHDGRAPDLRQASMMQLIGYYCFGEGKPGPCQGSAGTRPGTSSAGYFTAPPESSPVFSCRRA